MVVPTSRSLSPSVPGLRLSSSMTSRSSSIRLRGEMRDTAMISFRMGARGCSWKRSVSTPCPMTRTFSEGIRNPSGVEVTIRVAWRWALWSSSVTVPWAYQTRVGRPSSLKHGLRR